MLANDVFLASAYTVSDRATMNMGKLHKGELVPSTFYM